MRELVKLVTTFMEKVAQSLNVMGAGKESTSSRTLGVAEMHKRFSRRRMIRGTSGSFFSREHFDEVVNKYGESAIVRRSDMQIVDYVDGSGIVGDSKRR